MGTALYNIQHPVPEVGLFYSFDYVLFSAGNYLTRSQLLF